MKKGKLTMTITIGISCFVLALVMCMQFKIVNETDITSIETMRETELRAELANWKSKYEETNQKYEETISKIEEYENNKESNEQTAQLIEDEVQQTETLLGKTDVQGEGIEIILRDTVKDGEEHKIKASDLLIIVNSLRLAGAEAISINEQRLINMSYIVAIGENEFIRVNGTRILPPYIIEAIGNPNYLESAMLGNGGPVDELNKIGYDISIEKVKNVEIDKYNGDITTKYME